MASRDSLNELDFETVSFSALETYIKCPQLYTNKYIEKIDHVRPTQDYFLYGGWAHEIIEYQIRDNQPADVTLEFELPRWLEEINITLSQDDISDLIPCIKELGVLLYRASARCKEKSLALRTRDGSPLKDPVNFPSSSFKACLYKAEHYRTKGRIDNLAASQNEEFKRISLTWTLAQAFNLGQSFKPPAWVKKNIGVEMAFGVSEETKVELIPGVSLLGYIDWVAVLDSQRDEEGELAIIDHKTSKSKPTALEVLWNPQLNMYAYAYNEVYGKMPKIIAINHLRSGQIIAATVDPKVMITVVNHFIETLKLSRANNDVEDPIVLKHRPTDYSSPCITKDFRSGKVTSTCPFLAQCWPDFDKMLSRSNLK